VLHNRVCDGPECIGGLGLWQDANTQNLETLFRNYNLTLQNKGKIGVCFFLN
jgi:hypothetical protein